jgi:hypothetical protein
VKRLVIAALGLACQIGVWAAPAVDTTLVCDVRAGATVNVRIHPALPLYTFRLVGDKEHNVIQAIEVSVAGHPGVLQALPGVSMVEAPYRGAHWFEAVDANFDGYRDVRLMSWWGVTGNTGYTWWLFNPHTGRFESCHDLDDLSNPVPHLADHTISTHSVGGMAGQIYQNAEYRWLAGRLVLTREDSQAPVKGSTKLRHVVRERRRGVWATTLDTLVVPSF